MQKSTEWGSNYDPIGDIRQAAEDLNNDRPKAKDSINRLLESVFESRDQYIMALALDLPVVHELRRIFHRLRLQYFMKTYCAPVYKKFILEEVYQIQFRHMWE